MQEDCSEESRATRPCPWHPGWTLPHRLASVDIIGLFHFVTRSLEDYRTKMARAGGTNPKPKPIDFFDNWNRCGLVLCLDENHPLAYLEVLMCFSKCPTLT